MTRNRTAINHTDDTWNSMWPQRTVLTGRFIALVVLAVAALLVFSSHVLAQSNKISIDVGELTRGDGPGPEVSAKGDEIVELTFVRGEAPNAPTWYAVKFLDIPQGLKGSYQARDGVRELSVQEELPFRRELKVMITLPDGVPSAAVAFEVLKGGASSGPWEKVGTDKSVRFNLRSAPPPQSSTTATPGQIESPAPTGSQTEETVQSPLSLLWLIIPGVLLLVGGLIVYLVTRSRENRHIVEGHKGVRQVSTSLDDAFEESSPAERRAREIKVGGTEIHKGTTLKSSGSLPEVKIRSRVEPPQVTNRPGDAQHDLPGDAGKQPQSWAQQGETLHPDQRSPVSTERSASGFNNQPLARPHGGGERLSAARPLEQSGDADRLRSLEERFVLMNAVVTKLQAELGARIDGVVRMMDDNSGVQSELQRLRADLERKFKGDFDVLTTEQARQEQLLKQSEKTAAENRQLIAKVLEEIRKHQEATAQEVRGLRESVEKGGQRDELFRKVIELILAKSETVLGVDAFAGVMREAGEQLGVDIRVGGGGPAEGLDDLQRRARAIHDSVRAAVAQMKALDSKAEERLVDVVNRAVNLSSEMSQINDGLKKGDVNVKSVVNIPVSMRAGARESFLEGISRAVREALDKVHRPREYWERELQKFARGDVLNLVDICDKDLLKRPGANPEVEKHLQALFDEAGLRQILPAVGEPFKPAEQNMITMVAGGQSDRVASVVSRGFYYRDGGGREQLIRKASVNVYR